MAKTKAELSDFIHKHIHAVISTVTKDGKSESALIGFGDTPELVLIFGTDTTSRKYNNLKKNSIVSFVIGFGEEQTTIQLEGKVTELKRENWDEYLNSYHTKVPSAKKYKDLPNQAYFIFTPSWLRYTNFNSDPAEIFEVTL